MRNWYKLVFLQIIINIYLKDNNLDSSIGNKVLQRRTLSAKIS